MPQYDLTPSHGARPVQSPPHDKTDTATIKRQSNHSTDATCFNQQGNVTTSRQLLSLPKPNPTINRTVCVAKSPAIEDATSPRITRAQPLTETALVDHSTALASNIAQKEIRASGRVAHLEYAAEDLGFELPRECFENEKWMLHDWVEDQAKWYHAAQQSFTDKEEHSTQCELEKDYEYIQN